MKTYQKKPATVEAVQWPEDENADATEICAWLEGLGETFDVIGCAVYGRCAMIQVDVGEIKVRPGHWIIRAGNGTFSTVSPEEFAAEYEAA